MTQFTEEELRTIKDALLGGRIDAALDYVVRELDVINALAIKEQIDWDYWCKQFGLMPNDRGKVFTIKREAYRAVSINPLAPKFPVNAVRLSDNKPFRVPARCVK